MTCKQCRANLKPQWLKDGACNGCRNPDSIVVAVVPVKLPDYVLKALRAYLTERTPWTLIFHDMKLTAKQQREVLKAYKDPANRATARDYNP